jgi:uncharacterized protein (DUF2336 family)
MTAVAQPLIEEIQDALAKTSEAKYSTILSGVTDLFVNDAALYSDEHVALFDHVMGCLIEKIDTPALVRLSARLAPVDNAPPRTINRLAQHSDPAVCGPIFEKSVVIANETLVDFIKTTKSPQQLSAIAGRAQIGEPIADALVERGLAELTLKVVRNEGAKFSEFGYVKLVNRAGSNKTLAAAIAARKDVPEELRPFLTQALA